MVTDGSSGERTGFLALIYSDKGCHIYSDPTDSNKYPSRCTQVISDSSATVINFSGSMTSISSDRTVGTLSSHPQCLQNRCR